MKQILLLNSTIPFPYDLIRSRRITLVVYVRKGRVEVRAPMRAPVYWIQGFLREKTPWILDQLVNQKQKQAESLVVADGREFTFLGSTRRIVVVLAKQQKALLLGDVLYLYSRDGSKAKLEKIFNAWLLAQAREYMATQTIKKARILGVDHKLKEVVFRKTKSKWGHCCEDGTIQYNWLTMMAPREVVDYLIAHETSHLRHLNHSQKFWNTVESLCPDYKELRHWLANNGHRFWPRNSAY
jgi:predicted metal-dependent hydrolase